MKAPFLKIFWFVLPFLIAGGLFWVVRLTLPSGDEIPVPCTPNTVAVVRWASAKSIDKKLGPALKKFYSLADIHQATTALLQIDTLSKLFQAEAEITQLWERAGKGAEAIFYLTPSQDRAYWKTTLQGWAEMRGYSMREVSSNGKGIIEVRAGKAIVQEVCFVGDVILISASPSLLETYLLAPKTNLVVKRRLPEEALTGVCLFLDKGTPLLARIGLDVPPIMMREAYQRLDACLYPASKKPVLDFTANFRFSAEKCRWPQPMLNEAALKSSAAKPKAGFWTDWAINTEAQEVSLRPEVIQNLAAFDNRMLNILQRKPQLACGFGTAADQTLGFCLKVSQDEGVEAVQEIVQRMKASPVGTAGNTTVWKIQQPSDSTDRVYYLASRNEWLIMSRSLDEVVAKLRSIPSAFTEKAFSARIELRKRLKGSDPSWLTEQFAKFPVTASSLDAIEYDITGNNLTGSLVVLEGSYLIPKLIADQSPMPNAYGLKGAVQLAESDQKPGYAYAGQVGDSLVIFGLDGLERLAVKQNNPVLGRPYCTTVGGERYAFIATAGGVTALGFGQDHSKAVLTYPGDGRSSHLRFRKFQDAVYLSMLHDGDDAVYTAWFAKGKFSGWTQILEKSHIYNQPFLAPGPSALYVVYNVGGDSLRAIPIAGNSSSRTLIGSPGMSRIVLVRAELPGHPDRIGFITDRGLFHQYTLDSNILSSTKQIYRPNSETVFRAIQADNTGKDFSITRFDGKQYTFYSSEFRKEFTLDYSDANGSLTVHPYLFGNVQRYYTVCGKECRWYNLLGQEVFEDARTRPDLLFEVNGEVKAGRNVDGRLAVYRFK